MTREPAAAGWYPDPTVRGGARYWDGERWTDERALPEPPPLARDRLDGEPKRWRFPLWLIVVAAACLIAVVGAAALIARTTTPQDHAANACTKAVAAVKLGDATRYDDAAALMDEAIPEIDQAAKGDDGLNPLPQYMRSVDSAFHRHRWEPDLEITMLHQCSQI